MQLYCVQLGLHLTTARVKLLISEFGEVYIFEAPDLLN